jgi:hypothetical protein
MVIPLLDDAQCKGTGGCCQLNVYREKVRLLLFIPPPKHRSHVASFFNKNAPSLYSTLGVGRSMLDVHGRRTWLCQVDGYDSHRLPVRFYFCIGFSTKKTGITGASFFIRI